MKSASPSLIGFSWASAVRRPPLLAAFARLFWRILSWFDFFVMHPASPGGGTNRLPGWVRLHSKIIVAVDPEEPDGLGLRLAYRYARLRVVMARDRSLEVDAAGVRDAAEAARAALKRAQAVRLAIGNIDTSAKKAREGIDGMIAEVESELIRIESLVAGSDGD